jgi:hypothetical protein
MNNSLVSIYLVYMQYYVIAPDGTVEAYSGVEPLQLKELVLGKLSTDEL